MKIVISINHPAHVHYFKNFIWEMEKRGHSILIVASKKEVSYHLLHAYHMDFISLGCSGSSLLKKIFNVPIMDIKMYKAVKQFKPDLFLGFGSIRAAHVSKILRKPCIALDDTEHAKWEHMLYVPFTDAILTPSCFGKDFGEKQIRYEGYTELAYLHPNYFTPNPAVLTEIGLTENDPFIIIRFVSWEASHDVGEHGINDKVGLVRKLEKYGRVLITSEGALPEELEPYQIRASPEKLHDLLYYATLYVGEGATAASECAVLGTHAIYVNSLALGYIAEEDKKYYLVSDFSSRTLTDETVLAEAKQLLENENLKQEGKNKREILLQDKCDVTAFMVWFVENYPESVDRMKKDLEL